MDHYNCVKDWFKNDETKYNKYNHLSENLLFLKNNIHLVDEKLCNLLIKHQLYKYHTIKEKRYCM